MTTREGSDGAMRIHAGGSLRKRVCFDFRNGASSREAILIGVLDRNCACQARLRMWIEALVIRP